MSESFPLSIFFSFVFDSKRIINQGKQNIFLPRRRFFVFSNWIQTHRFIINIFYFLPQRLCNESFSVDATVTCFEWLQIRALDIYWTRIKCFRAKCLLSQSNGRVLLLKLNSYAFCREIKREIIYFWESCGANENTTTI